MLKYRHGRTGGYKMSNLIKIDEEYKIWIQKVSQRYQQSQIKAAIHVNVEMLALLVSWQRYCEFAC